MKFMKSFSVDWKFVVGGGWHASVEIGGRDFARSIIPLSELSDVTTSGGGRSMSEDVIIGLEGGGEEDNNFASANLPSDSVGASGSSTSLLGFGNEFIELSSSSCSRSITTLLVTEQDEELLKIGGDL